MKNFILITIGALLLLVGSVYWSRSMQEDRPFDVTQTCVQHGNLGMHIHPRLTIMVDEEAVLIPRDIGIPNPACMRPIHTHDNTGTLHIESTVIRDFTLGEFFTLWDKGFYEFGESVTMMVNGVENTDFENYIMRDGDEIVLHYSN